MQHEAESGEDFLHNDIVVQGLESGDKRRVVRRMRQLKGWLLR
jgi:hypothetical protein